MARTAIRQDYVDLLRQTYGTHTAVAKRLGISRNYYQRIRNRPEECKPSVALYNAIITLVNNIRLEQELIRRS